MKIHQALLSVSDKRGIIEFAQGLQAQGVTLLSTGGTAAVLRQAGLSVTEIGDYTGFPEILDGRVKTLHPKVHAGILARRDLPEHQVTLAEHQIPSIDLVCVNLYPFQETVAQSNVTLDKAIENIDIGGPTMVRAAAKNYQGVAVVTDPADYSRLLEEMSLHSACLTETTRFTLAQKAFVHTARYDSAIANWLTGLSTQNEVSAESTASIFPAALQISFDRREILRYGENPHQQAAFYCDPTRTISAFANYQQQQGKALSYNNIADADAAWECVKTFHGPACVIVKHANPCGVAVDSQLVEAYKKAFLTDTASAFGGIMAFNRCVDSDVVAAMNEHKHFVEVLLAPSFTPAARTMLATKNNLRVLEIPLELESLPQYHTLEMKRVGGGLLVQTPDNFNIHASDLKPVTRKRPTEQQQQDLVFAYRVAKFVKSNAIVFCRNGMTLGIGAGQMSRVDSTKIATLKAQQAGLALSGAVVASDAFFPFRDGIDVLAEAGAIAVIQPGGSMRDEEVIAAADEHGLAMLFTGKRHFRH